MCLRRGLEFRLSFLLFSFVLKISIAYFFAPLLGRKPKYKTFCSGQFSFKLCFTLPSLLSVFVVVVFVVVKVVVEIVVVVFIVIVAVAVVVIIAACKR